MRYILALRISDLDLRNNSRHIRPVGEGRRLMRLMNSELSHEMLFNFRIGSMSR